MNCLRRGGYLFGVAHSFHASLTPLVAGQIAESLLPDGF
jgi:hypothetical protein